MTAIIPTTTDHAAALIAAASVGAIVWLIAQIIADLTREPRV